MAEPAPEDAYLEWGPDQSWAVLVESEWLNNATGIDNQYQGHDAFDRIRGIPYRFVLEVHRPGMTPYRVDRRERVPAKVEGTYLGYEHRVPKGAEVPLMVNGPGPEDVAIDWDGYLRLPGRMRQTKRLEIENQWDAIGARFERSTKPATVAKIRANSRTAAMNWAANVRAGHLTRAEFDRNAEQLLRMGHLAADDYERAVLLIDE